MFPPAFVGRKNLLDPNPDKDDCFPMGSLMRASARRVKESTEDAEPSHFSNSGGRVLVWNWAVIIPIALCIFRDLDKAN